MYKFQIKIPRFMNVGQEILKSIENGNKAESYYKILDELIMEISACITRTDKIWNKSKRKFKKRLDKLLLLRIKPGINTLNFCRSINGLSIDNDINNMDENEESRNQMTKIDMKIKYIFDCLDSKNKICVTAFREYVKEHKKEQFVMDFRNALEDPELRDLIYAIPIEFDNGETCVYRCDKEKGGRFMVFDWTTECTNMLLHAYTCIESILTDEANVNKWKENLQVIKQQMKRIHTTLNFMYRMFDFDSKEENRVVDEIKRHGFDIDTHGMFSKTTHMLENIKVGFQNTRLRALAYNYHLKGLKYVLRYDEQNDKIEIFMIGINCCVLLDLVGYLVCVIMLFIGVGYVVGVDVSKIYRLKLCVFAISVIVPIVSMVLALNSMKAMCEENKIKVPVAVALPAVSAMCLMIVNVYVYVMNECVMSLCELLIHLSMTLLVVMSMSVCIWRDVYDEMLMCGVNVLMIIGYLIRKVCVNIIDGEYSDVAMKLKNVVEIGLVVTS
ncbi:hypothetical protein M896_070010, partial [Ordospora colligata OC4]